MEQNTSDISNSSTETTPVVTPASSEVSTTSTTTRGLSDRRKKFLLLLIGIVLTCIVVGLLVTKILENNLPKAPAYVSPDETSSSSTSLTASDSPTSTESSNSTSTNSSSSSTSSTEKLLTYSTTSFTFTYPESWTVTKEGDDFMSTYLVKKADHTLSIRSGTAGYGGVICIYPDSTDMTFAGPATYYFGEKVTIPSANFTPMVRNIERIDRSIEGNTYATGDFYYCKMETMSSDGKTYGNGVMHTKGGFSSELRIVLSGNPDPKLIAEIDAMAASFKSL